MKRVTFVLIAFALLLAPQTILAQESGTKLSRFRVLLTDGTRIDGYNGVLTSEGLNWRVSDDSARFILGNDIMILKRYAGSKAVNGMLIGAAAGALTVGLALINITIDDEQEVRDDRVVPVLAGFTAVGGFLGLIIGSSRQSWEIVPVQTAFRYDPESKEARLVFSLSF